MTNILKTRTLSAREGAHKVTLFIIEMEDGSRWYTTKGGHVAFNTYDKIVSGTNIYNLTDEDEFSYYGNETDPEGRIDTIGKLLDLVRMR